MKRQKELGIPNKNQLGIPYKNQLGIPNILYTPKTQKLRLQPQRYIPFRRILIRMEFSNGFSHTNAR